MSSETLDQMLSFVPQSSQKLYNTIDVYAIGTTAFYSGPAFDPSKFSKFGEFGSHGNFSRPLGDLNIGPIGKDPNSPGCVTQKPDYLEGGSERYRKPEDNHDGSEGTHMNYEAFVPGVKETLFNIHIPMDKKDK